ncbi:molybdenum cofactor guanylyltransferase [Vagococcus elongatus]|nr:molybdenum cofactor guanylyltransferase [Vagococcus elongatus]
MEPLIEATAAILCGGKSSRMGFDKSLLKIRGNYVLLETVKQLRLLFKEVILITDNKGKFPEEFGDCLIWEDDYINCGPLGGLVTALEKSKFSSVFLVACDMPKLDSALIRQMAKERLAFDLVIYEHERQLEPLFAFYRKTCLSLLKEQILAGDYRIKSNFSKLSQKKIVSSQKIEIKNVNYPEDVCDWY